MRILALDVGEERIGVAVSDALNMTAQGLETIERKGALPKINDLIRKYGVRKVIVGMPLNMNGTKGDRAKSTESFIELLEKEIPLDIETLDERLTTAHVERTLLEADVSRRKRKQSIDKIAAQLILQAYLDSQCTKE